MPNQFFLTNDKPKAIFDTGDTNIISFRITSTAVNALQNQIVFVNMIDRDNTSYPFSNNLFSRKLTLERHGIFEVIKNPDIDFNGKIYFNIEFFNGEFEVQANEI